MYRLKILKSQITRRLNYVLYKPNPILFDHIPKCAGNAVNQFLMRFYAPNITYSLDGVNFKQSIEEFKELSKEQQLRYFFIQGHSANKLIDYTHANAKVLTILRDPIDRVVSHYYYIKTYEGHFLHHKINEEKIELKDYCNANLSKDLVNEYTIHFSKLMPSEVEKNGDAAVDLAYSNILKEYHLIGFQLNLTAFFTAFLKLVKLPSRKIPTKKVNITTKRPKMHELDSNTLQAIEKSNQLDMILYKRLLAKQKNGVIINNH